MFPMPETYGTPAGIIGIRPFYIYGNYTRRSPIRSSFQTEWYVLPFFLSSFLLDDDVIIIIHRNTTQPGNYADPFYVNLLKSVLSLPSYNQTNSTEYLYSHSMVWCLAPTTGCLEPHFIRDEGIWMNLNLNLNLMCRGDDSSYLWLFFLQ